MMLRPLTKKERTYLEEISRSRTEPTDRVIRATVLLRVANGHTLTSAIREIGGLLSQDDITQLIARFNRKGLAALNLQPQRYLRFIYSFETSHRWLLSLTKKQKLLIIGLIASVTSVLVGWMLLLPDPFDSGYIPLKPSNVARQSVAKFEVIQASVSRDGVFSVPNPDFIPTVKVSEEPIQNLQTSLTVKNLSKDIMSVKLSPSNYSFDIDANSYKTVYLLPGDYQMTTIPYLKESVIKINIPNITKVCIYQATDSSSTQISRRDCKKWVENPKQN